MKWLEENSMKQINQFLTDHKIIAIVRGIHTGLPRLAQALYDGGIRAMEFTFDPARPESWAATATDIQTIGASMAGKMAIGAGTVTGTELVRIAFEAGARFIISPDTNAGVICATKELGMASIPGAMTPTEIETAYLAGADFVKVFPAGVLGPAYIKAIRGPLGHIPLMAVGGVSEKNISAFLEAGCVGAGIGGNLVNREWVAEGRWDAITAVAKQLCEQAGV